MKKFQPKPLFVLLLLGALGYGSLLFSREFGLGKINIQSVALANAVNIAFGQEAISPKDQRYASLVTKVISSECQTRSVIDSSDCVLATTGPRESYFSACQWWRFQNCAPLAVEPLFQKHPALMKALQDVIEHPCQFLPDDSAKALNRHLSNYIALGCNAPSEKGFKVILSIRSADPKDSLILYTQIGRKT